MKVFKKKIKIKFSKKKLFDVKIFKLFNLKIILLFIIILLSLLYKNEFLKKMNMKKFYLNEDSIIFRDKFRPLKDKPKNILDPILTKEKQAILSIVNRRMNRNVEFIDKIVFTSTCNFGNCLILINKLIFICELLGCKKIILNKYIYWFLKKKIIYKDFNMTIEVDDITKYNKSFLFLGKEIYYNFFYIKPENRMDVIKKEILSNLPKVKTNSNDLYIHFRSGNLFTWGNGKNYSQPPLCFYKFILNNFIFERIIIISVDDNNPVINKLINKYTKIFNM